MVPRTDMITVDAHTTVRVALDLFLDSRHSRLPVTSDDVDDIEGVLYLRDVAAFIAHRPDEAATLSVTKVMKPAVFVPESQKADDLLRQMQLESNHLAMVVDEYGGIAGLVTLEDLIEELVGDISDEHDREIDPVQSLGDHTYRVNARLPIDELGDLFALELDDDEVDTVGGLFTKLNGRLADSGDTVHVAGLILTADSTERRRKNLVSVIVQRDAAHGDAPDVGSDVTYDEPEDRETDTR